MTIAPTHNNHQRRIDNHGTAITLTNYETGTQSDYGEGWVETTNSPHTILARSWAKSTPSTDSDAYDQGEADTDRNFAVKENASGVSNIRDGGGKGASRIDFNGETYYVLNKDNQESGVIVLECENE